MVWQRPWQQVWIHGFCPGFSTEALADLADALAADSEEIVQQTTIVPQPQIGVNDAAPVEAGCPVAFCCWKGARLRTVKAVDEAFARACFEADQRLGRAAETRYWFTFWDDTPRHLAIPLLLGEVRAELARRAVGRPMLVSMN